MERRTRLIQYYAVQEIFVIISPTPFLIKLGHQEPRVYLFTYSFMSRTLRFFLKIISLVVSSSPGKQTHSAMRLVALVPRDLATAFFWIGNRGK